MLKQKKTKVVYMMVTIIAICIFSCLGNFEKQIFFNRTASMPIGLYVKISKIRPELNDIIIFKLSGKKGYFIKRIVGTEGDDVCIDFENTLWVNGLAVAQKNTEKYPEEIPYQSICRQLKEDEFLTLGEHQDSYDSRYFGPITSANLIAVTKPLWVTK